MLYVFSIIEFKYFLKIYNSIFLKYCLLYYYILLIYYANKGSNFWSPIVTHDGYIFLKMFLKISLKIFLKIFFENFF